MPAIKSKLWMFFISLAPAIMAFVAISQLTDYIGLGHAYPLFVYTGDWSLIPLLLFIQLGIFTFLPFLIEPLLLSMGRPKKDAAITQAAQRMGKPFGVNATGYVMQSDMLNAFASAGYSGHAVTITTALKEKLTEQQLNAVIAHEIGHLKHSHEIKVNLTWALCIFGPKLLLAIALYLSQEWTWLITALDGVLFFAGIILGMWVSRRIELSADAATKNYDLAPDMQSALALLSHLDTRWEWLSTHPNTTTRIAALAN